MQLSLQFSFSLLAIHCKQCIYKHSNTFSKVLLNAITRVGLDSNDVKLALMSVGIFFSLSWLAISVPDYVFDFQIKEGNFEIRCKK